MLKSWEQIQQALRRYPIRIEGAEATTFDWLQDGQPVRIFQMQRADYLGRQRVFLGVQVAADDPTWSHEALVLNSELAVGALVAFAGKLLLMHVMTVGGFDEAELHEVVALLAHTAARAQRRLLARVPKACSAYVD